VRGLKMVRIEGFDRRYLRYSILEKGGSKMSEAMLSYMLDTLDAMSKDYYNQGVEATLKLEGEENQRRILELMKDLNQSIGAFRAINDIFLMLRLGKMHE
jgi:hypothetical protein